MICQPYRCARDDYSAGILLDANENSLGSCLPKSKPLFHDASLERYPDPYQLEFKQKWADLRGLQGTANLYLGVGSDECIDMIMRVFCHPGENKILITPPTYGMYSVCAQINDVEVVKVPLDCENGRFQLDLDSVGHL
jgi:histidinol-phosphate aminotransferase